MEISNDISPTLQKVAAFFQVSWVCSGLTDYCFESKTGSYKLRTFVEWWESNSFWTQSNHFKLKTEHFQMFQIQNVFSTPLFQDSGVVLQEGKLKDCGACPNV